MKKRVFSIVLALVMTFSLCPVPAARADTTAEPYVLTAEAFVNQETYVKSYDRTAEAEPIIQATVNGETVTLEYEKAKFASRYVGSHDIVVEGLSVSGNYQLAEGFDSLTIPGRINTAKRNLRTGQVEVGQTLDLNDLVENRGTSFCECTIVGANLGAVLDGTLLTAADQPGVLTISVYVEPEDVGGSEELEYTGLGWETTTVTITEPSQEEPPPITQELPQEPLVIQGEREVVYGQTLQLSCSGGSTSEPVTWQVEPDVASQGKAEISANGLLTPVQAGKVWVTAIKGGNETYDEVRQTVEVTIRQAAITIAAKNKTAVMGEEAPSLTSADYTVTGLVGEDKLATEPTLTYETIPDMTKAGEVTIKVSGAAVPAGGNYDPNINYVNGKLIIGQAYPITIAEANGGTVTADAAQAPEGAAVTLTVQPAEGFELETLKVESGSDVLQTTEAGEGKVTFVMPAGGVLITPAFVEKVPEELPFTDVTETDWFYESVAYVYFNGLMNGTSATTFSPNGTTTRGMIVTILYRLAGSPETAAWSPFQDVTSDQYYAEPIAWAAWNGIVNGKTATSFGPNDPITREQMAAILYRYASFQGMDVSRQGDLTQFSDQGKISSYAREALAWANGAGLITGKGGGILDPQGPAVRAQVAAIFQRFCESAEP